MNEGKAEVRWFGKESSVSVPLEIYDEFTVHLFPNFSCNATPERYMIFGVIDFKKLTSLEIKTEKTIGTLWDGKAVKTAPLEMNFNIPEELLGIEAELYDYKGKFVYVTLSWDEFKKNLTPPVVNSRVWVPGQNASGKVRLILDLPRNVFVSATAYYLAKRKPVNEDFLRKEKNMIRFEYRWAE